MTTPTIEWSCKRFESLSIDEFYELLKLRIDIFVVEQACAYPELDGEDRATTTWHIQGRTQEGRLAACARLLLQRDEATQSDAVTGVRVGRVAVDAGFRGRGLARDLMKMAIGFLDEQCPGAVIGLSAQTYVVDLYRELGFDVESGEYLEDGIPHVDMRLIRRPV